MIGNYSPWLRGAAVAYPSASFDATAVVNSLVGDKCTTMMGVPTHFHMALEEVMKREVAGERFDFSKMRSVESCSALVEEPCAHTHNINRTGINGGSLVAAQLMKNLSERMNLTELAIIYGMSEYQWFPLI